MIVNRYNKYLEMLIAKGSYTRVDTLITTG